MTDPQSITCAECQSRLEEFVLDELSADVRTRVAEHLSTGCASCNQRLVETLSDFAQLAYSLPRELPPMRGERDLLKRIAAQRGPETADVSNQLPVEAAKMSPKSLTRRLVAAAMVLAATVVGIALWTTRHDVSSAATSQWAELQRRVDQANASQQFPEIPQLHFASVGNRSPEVRVEGYIVHDAIAKQWHVYAFRLPMLPAGHIYQVWFDMGDSNFVRAGVANADDEGSISCLVDAPPDLGAVRGLAISAESGADAERPSGDSLIEAPLP